MSSDMHDLLSRMADELDNYRQLLTDDRREVHALAAEARAALAAAPEGEPSDEELLEIGQLHYISYTLSDGTVVSPYQEDTDMRSEVLSFARAILARWGRPATPPAPVEGEVGELVAWLLTYASEEFGPNSDHPDAARIARAADLLSQQAAPAPAVVPVAVSERLPGAELCWWYEPDEDDDGSGYGGNWTLLRIRGSVSCYTHWLPAHALPLPAHQFEKESNV